VLGPMRPLRVWLTLITIVILLLGILAGQSLMESAASATTTTVVSVPGGVSVLGVSANGQYVLYDVGCSAGECVHWLNTQSGTDLTIGLDENLRAHLSSDGQHVVWEEFWGGAFIGGDPLGLGLSQGAIYEWTSDGATSGAYTQVSPTATAYPDGGLMTEYAFPSISSDGSVIAYAYRLATQSTCCSSGTTIVNLTTASTIDIPESDTWFDPAVLSPDGSVVGRPSVDGSEIDEYSTSDGSLIRSLTSSTQVELYQLSSDGLYGVGVSVTQYGLAYFDFSNDAIQTIPNSDVGNGCDMSSSIVSVSGDGQTVAFGASSDGTAPNPAGPYNGYFTYDPTDGNEVQINSSSVGPSSDDGGVCPSLSLTLDGQNAFLVAYNPTSMSSQLSSRSRRSTQLGLFATTTSGSSQIRQVSLPVATGPVAFGISTASLPGATRGQLFGPVGLQAEGVGVSASGYTTTLKWAKGAVTRPARALPKGLKLSSAGVLSGTPSTKLAAGASSIAVKVTETVTTLNGKKRIKTKTTVAAIIPLTIT